MRRGILNVTIFGSIIAACVTAGACGPIGSDGSTSLPPEAAAPVPDTGTPVVDTGTGTVTDTGTPAADTGTGGDAGPDAIGDGDAPSE
jgi:hypothetical protein